MAEITEPIMLDQTGQDIVEKLGLIKQAIDNQTNVPIATQSTPGIVKPGADMSVSDDGTLNIGDTIARNDVISDKYNASKTYTSGEYLIHNDILYRVLNTCQGITPPNASYYAPCTVGAEVSALKSTFTNDKKNFNCINCTLVSGGYAQIGHIVVVSARINISSQLSADTDFINGLPPISSTFTFFHMRHQSGSLYKALMWTDGRLRTNETIPSGEYTFTFSYVC